MLFKTVFCLWHSKQPVFSIDFHPSGRIATAGADSVVRVRVLPLNLGVFPPYYIPSPAHRFGRSQNNHSLRLIFSPRALGMVEQFTPRDFHPMVFQFGPSDMTRREFFSFLLRRRSAHHLGERYRSELEEIDW